MRRRDGTSKAPSLERSQILERNLAMLGSREESERARRSIAQRTCDSVTHWAAEPWFAVAHASWFGGWILLNSRWLPGMRPFDPFPFSFLTFVVSLEAIFLFIDDF